MIGGYGNGTDVDGCYVDLCCVLKKVAYAHCLVQTCLFDIPVPDFRCR